MTASTCPVCKTKPLPPGRTVCQPCVYHFRAQLAGLPVLMEAATAAVGGRLRFGSRVGARSTDTPVPVNLTASKVAKAARTTLLQQTEWVAQARNERTPTTWRGIQTFLDVRAAWVAAQPAGPDTYRAVLDALALVRRHIDRPPDRHYAGPCTATTVDTDGLPIACDGELYARTDKTTVSCPRCGAEYDVADRRSWLLEQAWDAVATGPDIARALAGEAFGRLSVNVSTIRAWASEGRLTRVDVYNGRPRYRIGDVLALATGTTTDNPTTDNPTTVKEQHP